MLAKVNDQPSDAPGDGGALSQFAPSAPVTGGRRIAAFFDLDKTIIAKSSAYAFGRQFVKSGLLSRSGVLQMALGQMLYISGGHDHEQMAAARDQLASMVTGWKASTVRQIAEESLHSVISPYVYSEAIDLIHHHQRLGHDVIIVSASATEVVEPIAETLEVDEVVATRLEVVDGRYTGEVPFFCRGANKGIELSRLSKERNYDLARSWAYSDSGTDVPMLEVVGHPVAVNPDKYLRRIAEERGWPIRDFRNPEPLYRDRQRAMWIFGASAVGTASALVGVGSLLKALRKLRPE